MSQPKNYLDTAWTHYSYINGAGSIKSDTSDASSRMTNAILMKAGTYRLRGINTSTKSALTYRFHEYSASDSWIRQVTSFAITELGLVDKTFILDHDSYIRVSMAINYFNGQLTKIA